MFKRPMALLSLVLCLMADSTAAAPTAPMVQPPASDVQAIGAAQRCSPPSRIRAATNEVIQRINAERRKAGLAAVRPSQRLTSVAQLHACDNAARRSYSHTGSDGSDLSVRLKRGGYRLRAAIENTGLGFDDPARLVEFWMHSPGHRANILNPAVTEAGLGLADGARPAWVMVMARPR